jgi:hypothetical protein
MVQLNAPLDDKNSSKTMKIVWSTTVQVILTMFWRGWQFIVVVVGGPISTGSFIVRPSPLRTGMTAYTLKRYVLMSPFTKRDGCTLKEVMGPGFTIVAGTLNPVSILLDASVSNDVIVMG